MPKLMTGRSLRGTTMTCSPFFSVKRWTGGSASSAGLGGAGERIRSLRFAQYSVLGLALGAPGTFSYWTWTADGGGAAGAGGGAEAQLARRTSAARSVHDLLRDITSSLPVPRVGRA